MIVQVLGAGVQGTLLGVRLARTGHRVTLVARGVRAGQLRDRGAIVKDATTGVAVVERLAIVEELASDTVADICFVTVRREQIDEALVACSRARGIGRFAFMVNHANGSDAYVAAVGRERVVFGFPGAGGGNENGVIRFVDVAEQPTMIDATAPDIAAILRTAGYRVNAVHDIDAWLKRHAVFVTAICGALYGVDCVAERLAEKPDAVGEFVLAIREGWGALDRRGIAPAPLALRMIVSWVPLPLSVRYWQQLLASVRGELYFARHARHAPIEMSALAKDVQAIVQDDTMPHLRALFGAIVLRESSN